MAACDYCTGTYYLSDTPDLGPCVCCTPEAMQKRDRTIEALTAPRPVIERLDELESAIPEIRDEIARLAREETDAADAAADAAAALSTYLVSIGLPSHPINVESEELAALIMALGVEA